MITRVGLVCNPKSGTAQGEGPLQHEFRTHGIEAISWPLSADLDIVQEAKTAKCTVIVAAGGDGTISAVAGQIVGTNLALGVLPHGTYNHFAKDLKIPIETADAIEVIKLGRTQMLDVAQVNQRYFINNSSIGIYPQSVRYRQESTLGKRLATIAGVARALWRRRSYRAVVSVDGFQRECHTPFIFIGNNSYNIDEIGINNRECLTAGYLSGYVLKSRSLRTMSQVCIDAVLGRAQRRQDFDALSAKSIMIDLPQNTVLVSYDGEIEQMSTPLTYRTVPASLRVITPGKK